MNTIENKEVKETIQKLHKSAQVDYLTQLRRRKDTLSSTESNQLWDIDYMAVTEEEGRLLYFLTILSKSKNIVEFGCSFGVSTIYLAAAAKDNNGIVTTTDINPVKVKGTKKNIKKVGLQDYVKILEGDALQTLTSVKETVDFLFLDGAKELYLPVFNLLKDKLKSGSVIFADNTDRPETRDFVENIIESGDFTTIFIFDKRAFVAYRK